jgi:hypothetical protein
MLRMVSIQPPKELTTIVSAGSAAWSSAAPMNDAEKLGTCPKPAPPESGNQPRSTANTVSASRPIQK